MATANKEAAFRSWWDQRLKEEKAEKVERSEQQLDHEERTAMTPTEQAAAKAYVDYRFRQALNPSVSASAKKLSSDRGGGDSYRQAERAVTDRTDAVLRAELHLLQVQIEHSEDRVQELRTECEAAKIGADRLKELNAVFDMKVKDSEILDRKITEILQQDESLVAMLAQMELDLKAIATGQQTTFSSPFSHKRRSSGNNNDDPSSSSSGSRTAVGHHQFLNAFNDDLEEIEAQMELEKQHQLQQLNARGGNLARGASESPPSGEKKGASSSGRNELLELRVRLQKALSDAELTSPMINYPDLLTVTSQLSQVKHRMAFDRHWCEAAMAELVDLQQMMDNCVKDRDVRDEEHAAAVRQLDSSQRDAFAKRKEITLAHKQLANRAQEGDRTSIELLAQVEQELSFGSMKALNSYIESAIRAKEEDGTIAVGGQGGRGTTSAPAGRQAEVFRRAPLGGGGGNDSNLAAAAAAGNNTPHHADPFDAQSSSFLTTPAATFTKEQQPTANAGLNMTPSSNYGTKSLAEVSWNQKRW